MKRSILPIAIAAIAVVWPLRAQLQVSSLDPLAAKAKEASDITLDGAVLQMAGKFLSGANKGGDGKGKIVTDMLSNLKAITVRNFEFAQEGQYRQEDLEPIRAQLKAPGWSKIVGNRSDRETSEIYTKADGNRVTGFAILAAEPKELTVVYIEGSIDLDDLSRLGGQFGIPPGAIPDVKGKNKSKDKGKDKNKGDQ